VNRLNRYAGLWEDQERAMRTPTSYRDAEWDLNTSPPMQWHFGPPPSGWGSYLSGANIQTARGQVVDARLFYTPPSVRFGRGFSGLGVVTATYREIAPGRYTTELTPYGIAPANAPRVPQLVISALKRRFGEVGPFKAGWGSGAQQGKVWVIFSAPLILNDAGIARALEEGVSEASTGAGGMLALPGQRPTGGVPASIALPADVVTLSARDLQTELARAGFNLGPSGVDGDFGSASVAALNAAVERTGIEGVRAKTRTSVTLTLHLLEAIRALPAADAPRGGRIDAGGPSGSSGGGGGVSGGSMGLVLIAAVGVGAYLMMRNR
jgi:hypothetical protein